MYSIYFWIEVNHDYILSLIRKLLLSFITQIPLAKEDDERLNADWHSWDWKGQVTLAALVGFLAFFYSGYHWTTLLIPIQIACLRMLILNIGLSYKWGLENKLHLGSGIIDRNLNKIFGRTWPIPIILILLLSIGINIWL